MITMIQPTDTPLQDRARRKQHGFHHSPPRGCHLNVGDLVVLKLGWTAKRVEGFTATGKMATSYGPDIPPENWEVRNWRDFESLEGQPADRVRKNRFMSGKDETMEKLYTWKNEAGVNMFGTKLSAMKDGTWVMELKGGAGVATVDPKKVERVMPYTVAVAFVDGNKKYHYFAKEDTLAKGDVIMVPRSNGSFGLAMVTDVDTKSERADVWLEGTILAVKGKLEGEDDA